MKLKNYLLILISVLYFDLIFNLFAYDSYLRDSFINITLFGIINSFVIACWNMICFNGLPALRKLIKNRTVKISVINERKSSWDGSCAHNESVSAF